MNGETDLGALLAGLETRRCPGLWQFITQNDPPDLSHCVMAFREAEGWTAIRPAVPDAKDPVWVWLEVTVESSLSAVGFTAQMARVLTEAGIPCNVVAAFHHDHLFVPADRAEAAQDALRTLRHANSGTA